MTKRHFDAPLSPLKDIDEFRANESSTEDLKSRILEFQKQSSGGVISIVGEWGIGKTSLVHSTVHKLTQEHGWQASNFEPYVYADYPSMLEGFFATLSFELKKAGISHGARKSLAIFFETISPYIDTMSFQGIPINNILRSTSKLLNKREDLATKRDTINTLFGRLDRPMVVVIDDLDRLDSNELMSCFKILRLLGKLDNVFFILCYDEQIVTELLAKTDLIGSDNRELAKRYLEKISQIKVNVLDLHGTEYRERFFEQMEALKNGLQINDLLEPDRLEDIWNSHLAKLLRIPRRLNKFVL